MHHSVALIIHLRIEMSGNTSGPDTYNIQDYGYHLDCYYNWDTISCREYSQGRAK
jgi:hypothetical protein